MSTGRDQMKDSGHPGKQLEHQANPGRAPMCDLGQTKVAKGVQRDEICVFTAPAHKKEGAFR